MDCVCVCVHMYTPQVMWQSWASQCLIFILFFRKTEVIGSKLEVVLSNPKGCWCFFLVLIVAGWRTDSLHRSGPFSSSHFRLDHRSQWTFVDVFLFRVLCRESLFQLPERVDIYMYTHKKGSGSSALEAPLLTNQGAEEEQKISKTTFRRSYWTGYRWGRQGWRI